MEDLFAQPEHAKNIYVIRRKLVELKPVSESVPYHYRFLAGKFMLKINTPVINERQTLTILGSEKVDVFLYEIIRSVENYIDLRTDPRFKDYQPIIYSSVQGINLGTGKDMPITHLCELIQYLYRLSNLTAFW